MDGAAPRRLRQSAALLVLCAAALGAVSFGPLRGDVFVNIDASVKFVQAASLYFSGYRSMALGYPAASLDPAHVFFPFDPPFAFRSGGQFQSIFPSAFAVLASVLAWAGPASLRVFGIAGGALAAVATAWLPDRRPQWWLAPLALAATPLWYYSSGAAESTVALAASTSAFAVALSGVSRAEIVAGVLLGVAAIFRDEALLLAPGLIYALRLRPVGTSAVGRLCLAVSAPIVAMALADWAWLDRPPLAHLRHALPWLNAALPRSRAVLPELAPMPWRDRIDTLAHYWWLGDGNAWLLIVAAGLAAAWLLRRHWSGPYVVAAVIVAAVARQAVDVGPLVAAPRFLTGLLRLSPFLLFAMLPAAPGSPPSSCRRVAMVTTVTSVALVLLTLSTTGGKGLGPRLTMGLWPLLIAGAWEGLSSWVVAARRQLPARAIAGGGILLVAGAVVMQLGVALPALAARTRDDGKALALVRQIPDRLVVLDDDVTMQLVGSEYFNRQIVFVARPDLWSQLGTAAAAAGETRLLVVSRGPRPQTAIPPFHFAEEWTVSRYWIGRWVR